MAEWCGCIGFALDDTWPGEHKDLEKIWYMLLIFSIWALYICSFILGFWWSPTSEFSGTWIQRYNSLWAKTLQSTMDGSIVYWYWILAKKTLQSTMDGSIEILSSSKNWHKKSASALISRWTSIWGGGYARKRKNIFFLTFSMKKISWKKNIQLITTTSSSPPRTLPSSAMV